MRIKAAVVLRLRELCWERNITYNELATRSGVTPSTVYSLLDARRKEVSVTTIQKLCDGLEISIAHFFSVPLFENIEQEIE